MPLRTRHSSQHNFSLSRGSEVMSVLLNTSAGDIVIDLFVDECPIACRNFLNLCRVKYYNGCLFYNVQQNFICQTGDPTGTGKGGDSFAGLQGGTSFFQDEVVKRRIDKVGMVCMARGAEDMNLSQFFFSLRGEDMDQFKGQSVFGEVAEGLEVLEAVNCLYCDAEGRPYQVHSVWC
ncbi:cyclophilin-like domain-containing protein [Ochromonadaceae sp. CCMP2298]|nr:cyclophilin-like domain-containing protein [Ochromonadaceae sp. CCMP2298]